MSDSVTFNAGGEYSRVLGRIIAYQWGATDAFWSYSNEYSVIIDNAYVDGVSVTHGSPLQRIWTFTAGHSERNPTKTSVCSCDASRTILVPSFVGEHYFCESGLHVPWTSDRHFTIVSMLVSMTSRFTPVTLSGIDRTVSPTAGVGA